MKIASFLKCRAGTFLLQGVLVPLLPTPPGGPVLGAPKKLKMVQLYENVVMMVHKPKNVRINLPLLYIKIHSEILMLNVSRYQCLP